MRARPLSATLPDALLDAHAYAHDVDTVRVVETHMSWVFLTGDYAYKVKKPVRFDFVDFSALADRRRFCEAELVLNRRFAPDLYLSVEPISLHNDRLVLGGTSETGGTGETVDWAVRMRQFDTDMAADRLIAEGRLTLAELQDFAARLAQQHGQLPRIDQGAKPAVAMLANFATLAQTQGARRFTTALAELEAWTQGALRRLDPMINTRAQNAVRDCHGDLHLGNIVRTEAGLEAFDCLEFNLSLRQIDICSDIAFLFMDLAVRGRTDLAYGFIDAYMDASGDYEALTLLNLYAVYRAVVRAKVAALRLDQTGDAAAYKQLSTQITWARARTARPAGRLIITCGLSGSGKSYWARQLVPELGALRLRSDVLRKHLAGLAPQARSGSGIDDGIYAREMGECTYDALARLASSLLADGETVIVDATNLQRAQRQRFYDVATDADARCTVLYFTAPESVLQERIAQRTADASDASEADSAVLAGQMQALEPPAADEPVVILDTEALDLRTVLKKLEAA